MNPAHLRTSTRCSTGWVAVTLLFSLLLLAACSEDEQTFGSGSPEGPTFLSVAREIAGTWMGTLKAEQIDWSWGDGVLTFGLSQLAGSTGEEEYWDYLQTWMDHRIQEGYYFAFSDNCPTGIAAARLFEEAGESRYRDVLDRIWNYLSNVADRTSDGGLNHMGFLSGKQIWVDSLFMFGVALNEMSRLLEDPVYWEELARQIRVFSTHLRNPENGLFLHMWDDDDQKRIPVEDTFWARGNAWVFVMLVEFLTTLPEQSPLRQEFLPHLTLMADTLAGLQADSGLWHTVLYDPGTYQETSASALFAYGFHKSTRLGLLDSVNMAVVRKTMRGLESRLVRGCNGGLIVSGTSHGTDPGEWEHYASITLGDQVPYGVGALLLATVEVGDWSTQGDFAERTSCPDIPEDPQTAEEYITRAVHRLELSDLEGAYEDFNAFSSLESGRGEGSIGSALIQAFFAGFEVFDAYTRTTIDEIGWGEFQQVIREEALPQIAEIRQKLVTAEQDDDFSLHIPVMYINRRGLYTPLLDLRFTAGNARFGLGLLDIVEGVFRLLS